jgi:hypothetical protein
MIGWIGFGRRNNADMSERTGGDDIVGALSQP